MKQKFSIFSPTSSKVEPSETSINFKKSPNKFAVYEPDNKIKETPKYIVHQSLSSTNLEGVRRLPHEYSNLRQTLNFKTSDFEGWMHEQERDKAQKSTNILRQTFNTKPSFRPKSEKIFSESFSGHEFQSAHDIYHRGQQMGALGYSKINTSNLTQSKSLHTLYDPRINQRKFQEYKKTDQKLSDWKDLTSKWQGNEGIKSLNESQQHSKIIKQIQILKRIAGNNNQQEEFKQPKSKTYQRKYSQNISSNQYLPQIEQSVFRKKAREKQQLPQEFFTPKVPKYTYQERFKKIGSPTSTDNSDSRSPPNKFVEITDIKKKSGKISMDDFTTGKVLGEGKFGVVMIAKHKKSGTFIALKKIPKAMIKSNLMVEQLTLQIRLQSCLNHKNILSMYGFFDDSTHLYIVLEYMDQGTLYSQLKKNRILTQIQCGMIIKQITEAVDYLHDHDIAHRDIKPQNIVVSNNVYKLCDFGWATICNERRKTYCGTFDYAAPQILQGKQYDMSVDLWCLGVMTFELLTGKAPFYHISRKQTMKRIINVQTQSIIYPQSMSKQAIDFIQKLIRKDPGQRMKASDALKHPFLKNALEQ